MKENNSRREALPVKEAKASKNRELQYAGLECVCDSPKPLFTSPVRVIYYSSQLFTVRGNGMTSRMLPMPVRYITQRSNPRPKPACLAEPYFLRSK